MGYSRGEGKPVGECAAYEEKGYNGCYPKCSEGYSGAGVFCPQDCPNEFKNFAYYCMKPTGYWRGTGKNTPCENCEKFGLLYYEKCKEGYHAWGCCNCKYECPKGMRDLTTMCLKDTYKRGPAREPKCADDPNTEEDPIEERCYTKCAKGYTSGGSMCWKDCKEGTSPCGGVLCLDDRQKDKCTDQVMEALTQVLDDLKIQAAEQQDALFNAGMIVPEVTLPVCY